MALRTTFGPSNSRVLRQISPLVLLLSWLGQDVFHPLGPQFLLNLSTKPVPFGLVPFY